MDGDLNERTTRKAIHTDGLDSPDEADARLTRYALLVYRIYQRIRADPMEYAALKRRLTEGPPNASIDGSITK
jgi:hypothetical protein